MTPFLKVLDWPAISAGIVVVNHQGMVTTGIFLKRKIYIYFLFTMYIHTYLLVWAQKWHLAVSSNSYSKVQFISLTNNPQVVPPLFFNVEKYFKMVETGLKVSLKSLYNVILTSHCLIQRPRCTTLCIFSVPFHLKCSKTKTSVAGGVSLQTCFSMSDCLKLHLCEILILRGLFS